MLSASKTWRGILLGVLFVGLVSGPLSSARAEEPEPPLVNYDANWPGSGIPNLEIRASVVPGRYTEVADDLILPAGEPYGLVTNVNVEGNLPTNNIISSVTVRFYKNNASLPGNQVYNSTVTGSFPNGNLQLTLPTRAALRTNQIYWLSVQAQLSNPLHDWYWKTRNPQVANPAAMRTNDVTLPMSCQIAWAPRSQCDPGPIINGFGPDLTFQLVYTPFTPTEFLYFPLVGR